MKEKTQIKIYFFPIIVISLLTAFDQLTKFMITSKYELYESKDIIKDVFSLTYIRNEGIAWGMMEGKQILFVIISAIVLIGCFYIYSNISDNKRYRLLRIAMLFLVSGAIGNMIDRINLNYVIDFFSFDLINFPVFNVADIYVVCSMIVIFLLIMFKYKDEDFDIILHGEKIEDKEETEEKGQ